MNTKQKTVAAVALAGFAATVIWAPWTVTLTSADFHRSYSATAPIWNDPDPDIIASVYTELRIGQLLVEWAAIGIFAGSLLMIFREKH
jgi:hypothetical protein